MVLRAKKINGTCGAHSRSTGKPCKMMAVKPGGRCRIHGGLSTGPRTIKGKKQSSLTISAYNTRRRAKERVLGNE